jgi:hypothetical protein
MLQRRAPAFIRPRSDAPPMNDRSEVSRRLDSVELTRPTPLEADFSVVIGGPLYQALRRAHLADDALDLVRRRVVMFAFLAWAPPFALAMLEGTAWGGAVILPFLFDVDTHVRFLVALPLMLVAELVVHQRMRTIVAQFVSLGLVTGEARARFDTAIARAMRLRNSVAAEVLLILLVYSLGRLALWRDYVALDAHTWYATPRDGTLEPTLAGWWYLVVSLPLFQFLLLRWYFRVFVWARFLWQVSRLDVAYAPMHPDRTGGIGFLARIPYAFAPLLVAQGALLAGTLANRILFGGATLPAFVLDVGAVVALAVGMVIAPQLVFVQPLASAKRTAMREYGHLAKRYVDEFEARHLRGRGSDEPLLGSADLQSLADMGNSYEVVRAMRVVPVTRDALAQLVVMTLLPIAPLLLTMISLEDLLGRLLKIIF